jgi:hypothetical protein
MSSFSAISNILYFVGYTYDFEANIRDPPLDIELGKSNTFIAKQRNKKDNGYNNHTYIYNIFIGGFIVWSVIYSIVISFLELSTIPFGRSLFQLIIFIQYINGIIYFRKNHFYENIVSNSDLTDLLKLYLPITTLVSIVISILNIVLLIVGFSQLVYSDIYNSSDMTGKVFILILMFLENIYSYQSFTINTCIFVINMIYHRNNVKDNSEKLTSYVNNSVGISQKMNALSDQLLKMKDKFDNTVKVLSPFFTILNVLGFFSIYYFLIAIEREIVTSIEIINIIIFALVELIYILSIQDVNKHNENISGQISSSSLIATLFANKKFEIIIPKDINKKEVDKYTPRYKKPIDDNPYNIENSQMIKQCLIASVSTDQTTDWLVLQKIVSDRWETFKIFGVELTDSKLISRIIGLLIGVLISAELGNIFDWWN